MNKDIRMLTEAYSRILNESLQTIEKFKNNLVGAFMVTFDIDRGDIATNYKEGKEVYDPYSSQYGMRNYSIDFDYRLPKKCNNSLSCYIAIRYKMEVYLIDLIMYYWKQEPQKGDFMDVAHGNNLEKDWSRQKVGVETGSILTVSGQIKSFDKNDGEEDYLGVFGYPEDGYRHYKVEGGNLGNLVKEIKNIIDGEDDKEDKEEYPDPIIGSGVEDEDLVTVR